MFDVNQQVRGQLIPLRDMQLVLPNTCIAEVIGFNEVQTQDNGPDWLLGSLTWRGMQIPVVCFESASTHSTPLADQTWRIAVLNNISGRQELPFYGLVIQGIPHLVTLNSTNINAVTRPDDANALALQHVMIGEQSAIIPDLDKLESLLQQYNQANVPESG